MSDHSQLRALKANRQMAQRQVAKGRQALSAAADAFTEAPSLGGFWVLTIAAIEYLRLANLDAAAVQAITEARQQQSSNQIARRTEQAIRSARQ